MKPTQSYLEALAAWEQKSKAWNKALNEFYKKHPFPPRTEEQMAWDKEFSVLMKRHLEETNVFYKNQPTPPRTKEQDAWDKENYAFNKRHPRPTKPLPEYDDYSSSEAASDHSVPVSTSQSIVTVSTSNSLVPVSDREAGRDLVSVLPKQPTYLNTLNQDDEAGKQKYISGKTSEVLLLEDSKALYERNSREIIEVDEATPIRSSLGSKRAYMELDNAKNGKLLCLPSNTDNRIVAVNRNSDYEVALQERKALISIDHCWKKTKTSESGSCSTVRDSQTSNDLDDDVYEIPPPLDQTAAKSKKNKGGYRPKQSKVLN